MFARKRKKRTHPKVLLQRALLIKAAVVAAVLIPASALIPTWDSLSSEGRFADAVKKMAQNPQMTVLRDNEIRSAVQAVARTHGFHIEFEDIFVEYIQRDKETNMILPSKLGYTLHMILPLFGLLPWPVMAVRSFAVAAQTGEARMGNTPERSIGGDSLQ